MCIQFLIPKILKKPFKNENSERYTTQSQNHIAKSLKELAVFLEIPVIVLTQLSRDVELRGGDKRPLLSDLQQSEALENCADNIIFIYRPEYYGMEEDEYGKSTMGSAELILSKHKNGPQNTVNVSFKPNTGLFVEENEFEKAAAPGLHTFRNT